MTSIKSSKEFKEAGVYKAPGPYTYVLEAIKAEGEYYTTEEVKNYFQMSRPTLQKICSQLNAPSMYYDWGRRYIFLYTREDIVEIAEYLGITLKPNWKIKHGEAY
jgi:hypothetical protein